MATFRCHPLYLRGSLAGKTNWTEEHRHPEMRLKISEC